MFSKLSQNQNLRISDNFRFEQNWFFPERKETVFLYTSFKENELIPVLFKLNLNTLDYTQIFPLYQEDYTNISLSLLNIQISKINKGVITYNTDSKKYLIVYSGLDNNPGNPQPFVLEFVVTDWDSPRLQSIKIYKDTTSIEFITTPPLVLDVNNNLVFTDTKQGINFGYQLPILNGVTSCMIISNPTGGNVSISNNGFFSGNVPNIGTYQVNFSATNNVGTTYYAVTLVVN